jgi:PLD-like domain
MLIRKLTVPLINEEILKKAVSCSIASGAISEPGFDFIISRISKNCTCRVLTGLDLPTSPKVLWKAFEELPERMQFKIFTSNFFHPKVYIFQLPDNKKVAFLGSGNFTMGGFKNNEELFYKLINPVEIETLTNWFDDYFQKSIFLTEDIIKEYEQIYPSMKDREENTRREKKQFTDQITGAFNWDNIDFTNQYFKKEDYLAFENSKASFNTPEIRAERTKVQNKMLDLHEELKAKFCKPNGLHEHYDSNHIISSLEPINHHENKVRSMWLAYGRNERQLRQYSGEARHMDFIRMQIIVQQQEFGIWLMPGKQNGGSEDREYFREQMMKLEYRNRFYKLLTGLGQPYWILVAQDFKDVSSFANADQLWEFTKKDNWIHYYFTIGRDYGPEDYAISENNIINTITSEFSKLLPLYIFMKDKSFN